MIVLIRLRQLCRLDPPQFPQRQKDPAHPSCCIALLHLAWDERYQKVVELAIAELHAVTGSRWTPSPRFQKQKCRPGPTTGHDRLYAPEHLSQYADTHQATVPDVPP